EGVFHESLNFASLKKLPIVFVCENNFYATYSHQSARQCADNIYERAAAYRIIGERVDGNDVQAVYQVVGRAVQRARAAQGPSLIECRTYRWREHVGPLDDTHLGYRSAEEVQAWKERCPLLHWEQRLCEEGLLNPEKKDRMTAEIDRELEEAFQFAKISPLPDPKDLARGVTS
ncbi:MAG: thiamine pyrophosphate-dependent dehydrogenase E1 component subunit alpha, partial [Candidatus Omnitrophica bacterium]|nr:thiamine pyrophosphate-dependent dehydrogenase E1 component subunit alpha [Candidatus Omnitrophota bacterium]